MQNERHVPVSLGIFSSKSNTDRINVDMDTLFKQEEIDTVYDKAFSAISDIRKEAVNIIAHPLNDKNDIDINSNDDDYEKMFENHSNAKLKALLNQNSDDVDVPKEESSNNKLIS